MFGTKGILTPQQARHQKSREYGRTGSGRSKLEREHSDLNKGHCACRFCFTWTSHEPRLPEADIPPPPADPSIPEVSGKQPKAPSRQSKVVSEEPKEKMLLPDDHRTAHVLLSRWQQWMHCHGDDTGTKSHVHAKYCKAFCPNGHYVMPNGRQTHGVYEGTYRELLDDMEALRVRLESVEDPDCHVQNVCIRCGGKCFPGADELPLCANCTLCSVCANPCAAPPRKAQGVEAICNKCMQSSYVMDEVSYELELPTFQAPPKEPLPANLVLPEEPHITPFRAPPGDPLPPKKARYKLPEAPVIPFQSFETKQLPAPLWLPYLQPFKCPLGPFPDMPRAPEMQEVHFDEVFVPPLKQPEPLLKPARPQMPPAPMPVPLRPQPIGYVEAHRPLFVVDISNTMNFDGRLDMLIELFEALLGPKGEVAQYTEAFGLILFNAQVTPQSVAMNWTSRASCHHALQSIVKIKAEYTTSLHKGMLAAYQQVKEGTVLAPPATSPDFPSSMGSPTPARSPGKSAAASSPPCASPNNPFALVRTPPQRPQSASALSRTPALQGKRTLDPIAPLDADSVSPPRTRPRPQQVQFHTPGDAPALRNAASPGGPQPQRASALNPSPRTPMEGSPGTASPGPRSSPQRPQSASRPQSARKQRVHPDAIYIISDGEVVDSSNVRNLIESMHGTEHSVPVHCVGMLPKDKMSEGFLQLLADITGGSYCEYGFPPQFDRLGMVRRASPVGVLEAGDALDEADDAGTGAKPLQQHPAGYHEVWDADFDSRADSWVRKQLHRRRTEQLKQRGLVPCATLLEELRPLFQEEMVEPVLQKKTIQMVEAHRAYKEEVERVRVANKSLVENARAEYMEREKYATQDTIYENSKLMEAYGEAYKKWTALHDDYDAKLSRLNQEHEVEAKAVMVLQGIMDSEETFAQAFKRHQREALTNAASLKLHQDMKNCATACAEHMQHHDEEIDLAMLHQCGPGRSNLTRHEAAWREALKKRLMMVEQMHEKYLKGATQLLTAGREAHIQHEDEVKEHNLKGALSFQETCLELEAACHNTAEIGEHLKDADLKSKGGKVKNILPVVAKLRLQLDQDRTKRDKESEKWRLVVRNPGQVFEQWRVYGRVKGEWKLGLEPDPADVAKIRGETGSKGGAPAPKARRASKASPLKAAARPEASREPAQAAGEGEAAAGGDVPETPEGGKGAGARKRALSPKKKKKTAKGAEAGGAVFDEAEWVRECERVKAKNRQAEITAKKTYEANVKALMQTHRQLCDGMVEEHRSRVKMIEDRNQKAEDAAREKWERECERLQLEQKQKVAQERYARELERHMQEKRRREAEATKAADLRAQRDANRLAEERGKYEQAQQELIRFFEFTKIMMEHKVNFGYLEQVGMTELQDGIRRAFNIEETTTEGVNTTRRKAASDRHKIARVKKPSDLIHSYDPVRAVCHTCAKGTEWHRCKIESFWGGSSTVSRRRHQSPKKPRSLTKKQLVSTLRRLAAPKVQSSQEMKDGQLPTAARRVMQPAMQPAMPARSVQYAEPSTDIFELDCYPVSSRIENAQQDIVQHSF
ncbi:hypothetical protein CYMTET_54883 [Cymbomonas tetramitiformis]|uniref:VWFA domain-containing protein n=1 Tax=Cymbomonas tetramitiformis TaxID=36881 RepID=A0AAE0EP44_9CHLO|nr:hypothetical protein CYMTET_54883 [Cymbomonas tetramitiformis]